jgi:hypothetical protein
LDKGVPRRQAAERVNLDEQRLRRPRVDRISYVGAGDNRDSGRARRLDRAVARR